MNKRGAPLGKGRERKRRGTAAWRSATVDSSHPLGDADACSVAYHPSPRDLTEGPHRGV